MNATQKSRPEVVREVCCAREVVVMANNMARVDNSFVKVLFFMQLYVLRSE